MCDNGILAPLNVDNVRNQTTVETVFGIKVENQKVIFLNFFKTFPLCCVVSEELATFTSFPEPNIILSFF